jgi:uncharacterized protein
MPGWGPDSLDRRHPTLESESMGGYPADHDRLQDLVQRLGPMRPVRILLFGSAARNQRDHMSDIDVIVVAERVAPRFLDRIAEAYDLVDPRYALDILIYTPTEYAEMRDVGNPLIEAAEAEGWVLYQRPAA